MQTTPIRRLRPRLHQCSHKYINVLVHQRVQHLQPKPWCLSTHLLIARFRHLHVCHLLLRCTTFRFNCCQGCCCCCCCIRIIAQIAAHCTRRQQRFIE